MGKQEVNLRLAKAHKPNVEASLHRLNGTAKVRIDVYTGLGGALHVSGDVADDQTVERVIDAIWASRPPVTVQFQLTVGETNVIQRVVEPTIHVNASSR